LKGNSKYPEFKEEYVIENKKTKVRLIET